jgi:hypothetical protein
MFFVDEDARGIDTVWWAEDRNDRKPTPMLTALDALPDWINNESEAAAGELWQLIVDAVNRSNQ